LLKKSVFSRFLLNRRNKESIIEHKSKQLVVGTLKYERVFLAKFRLRIFSTQWQLLPNDDPAMIGWNAPI
jgi:hypothetical protein